MITVFKIGGNVIDSPETLSPFLSYLSGLESPFVLIHGGGKIASELMNRMGIKPVMVDGRRVTDMEALEVVTMVYGGLINKQIVAELQKNGCNAIGITGADGNCILATKRAAGKVDYGYVGDVSPKNVNAPLLKSFLDLGLIPVVAPLTHDGNGSILNTNADTVASSVACGLASLTPVRLVFCFEKNGVLNDPEDNNSVIEYIDRDLFSELKENGVVSAGMLPKLENAFTAIDYGVKEVVICGIRAFDRENPVKGTTIR